MGAGFIANQLPTTRPPGLILGVNLGKNKHTPLERAADDYLSLMQRFAPLADYLAVNVSSPNTVGLRHLQARQALDELLAPLVKERLAQQEQLGRRLPLLVKLAPDLDDQELDDALDVILTHNLDGVIATNTTISRDGLASPLAKERGGLSGAPLRQRSTQLIQKIYQRTQGKLHIIGVGGIMNADDARAKLDAGALLVQIYTGLIYAGPGLVKQIITRL
jgi:dihydroorotate dehydrogenase